MAPLMYEYITGKTEDIPNNIRLLVESYINESTGIQTIHQMEWLCQRTIEYNNPKNAPCDAWFFKNEYNKRLMQNVAGRLALLNQGSKEQTDFLIRGSREFLEALYKKGILLFTASGTDEADVIKEAEALGVSQFFQAINGAKPHSRDCSKEAVLSRLLSESGFRGEEILVIGDGKVEIKAGLEIGALTLGIASVEEGNASINEAKRERLIKAGAHAVVPDFSNINEILDWI